MNKIPLMKVYWNKVISYSAIPLYRNAIYLMLNTAATSLLGFFFWLAVARIYSETEVGYSSAIISVIFFLSNIGLLGFNWSLVRFLPQADRPVKLINSTFTLCSTFTVLIAGIFVAGLSLWSPALLFIGERALFTVVFIGTAVLSVLSMLVDDVFLARRRAVFILIKDASTSFLKIILVFAFAAFLHTFGVIASWGLSLGAAFIISLLMFIPKVQDDYKPIPSLDTGQISGMWKYSSSSYLASMFSFAEKYIVPLIVLNLLGTYSNAYFYIAWMMANLLFSIPASTASSLFTESTNFRSDRDLKNNVVRSLKFTYLILVPALVILLAASNWLLLAFGEGYQASALTLLWMLSFSSLFVGINSVYISVLRARDKLFEFVTIRAVSSLTILALSYVLLPIKGINGIGYLYLGVQGLMAIVLGIRLYFFINKISSHEQ